MAESYRKDDVVIVEATRSILGATNGSLREITAAELGCRVAEGLLTRIEGVSRSFSRRDIDHFIVGNSIGAGIGQNLPRQIAELADFGPVETAYFVNELCGSSLEAVILGAQSIRLGESPMVLVGGVEAPSAAPYLISNKQLIEWQDRRVEEIQTMVEKSDVHDALWWPTADAHAIAQAEETTAEWVAAHEMDPEDFKQEIDAYAIMSHRRALAAIATGQFTAELTCIPGTSDHDELPQEKSPELLAKRRGTHLTPDGIYLSYHNSPILANGAAFMLLTTYGCCESLGVAPLARLMGYGRSSVSPKRFLLAPVPAVRDLLHRTGAALADFDLLEMNTAFGSQILISSSELGLDVNRVNVSGDCIALGHPVGAAGARLLTTLLYGLKREDKERGLVSICLGGGNAIALGVERLCE